MLTTERKGRIVNDNAEQAELEIEVEGMSCEHCVATVTSAVRAVPGVEDAIVDLQTGMVKVRGSVGAMQRQQVVEAIKAAGYSAS
jgi:copper chaperone CopZ